MTDVAKAVGELVALAGGSVEGKTRLQKSDYFLESRGVGYGFTFAYHYYGPYSEGLAVATDDAAALKFITPEVRETTQGLRYVAFRLGPSGAKLDALSSPKAKRRKGILDLLAKYDAVTLELAATADFLARNGHRNDSWEETIRRKKAKATPSRLSKAKQLLEQVDGVLKQI
jgi:uncharacterized protein YwgA